MAEAYGIQIDVPQDLQKEVKKEDYQKDVKDVLRQIAGNPVGRVILAAIEDLGDGWVPKKMTIVPYSAEDAQKTRQCNAVTYPDSQPDSAPKGFPVFHGDVDQPGNGRTSSGTGTGLGSNTKVHFTASMWGPCGCGRGVYAGLADEVLLHEMVHGLRDLQGLAYRTPTRDSLAGYKTEEEFLAIVVTNVYISAKPSTLLRAAADASIQLKAPLNTSAGFLTDSGHNHLMRRYYLLWQPTFQELGRVGTPDFPVFNPFRELMKEAAPKPAPAPKKPVPYWGNDDKEYKEWRWSKF
jgi:hypothetical protein